MIKYDAQTMKLVSKGSTFETCYAQKPNEQRCARMIESFPLLL